MRQLKTLMRNIKKDMLACWDCQCRTLQCRRHSDGNCWCDWWGWGHRVSVIRDEDYSWRTWTVWETYTLWFTISPSDTQFQFSTDVWYVRVPSWDTSEGHHNINMQVLGTYDRQWIGGDTLYIRDETTWEIYSSIPVTTIRYADSLNVETTEVEAQAYSWFEIPFTYSPSNWYPIDMMSYTIDDDNIVQSPWVSNWREWNWTISMSTAQAWITQVHISSTNHPEDIYTVDVKVLPQINEVNINTDPITIDLDNSSTYTIPFTYAPSDWYFNGLWTATNGEWVAFAEIEKTNAWEGNLNIFWRGSWQTSVALITPDWNYNRINVTTTSAYPNVDYLTNISSDEIYMCGTWSSATRTFEYAPTDAIFGSVWVTVENPSVINATIVKDSDWYWHVQIDSLVNEWASWVYLWYINNNGSTAQYSVHCTIVPAVESISLDDTSDCVMGMGETHTRRFEISPERALLSCLEAYSDDNNIATVQTSYDGSGGWLHYLYINGQWTAWYTQVHLWNDDIWWIDINVYVSCITNIDDSNIWDITVAEWASNNNFFTYTPTDADVSSFYATPQDSTICETFMSAGVPWEAYIVVQWLAEWQTTVTYGNDVVGYNTFNVTVTAPL